MNQFFFLITYKFITKIDSMNNIIYIKLIQVNGKITLIRQDICSKEHKIENSIMKYCQTIQKFVQLCLYLNIQLIKKNWCFDHEWNPVCTFIYYQKRIKCLPFVSLLWIVQVCKHGWSHGGMYLRVFSFQWSTIRTQEIMQSRKMV